MIDKIISDFNLLLTALILWLISFLPRPPAPKIVTPTPIPTSLVVPSANPPKKYIETTKPVPWGTTEKIADHLYRTYVADDPSMGTPDEILKALNIYRHIHSSSDLRSDNKLCLLAKMRAGQQEKLGTLDSHKGLVEYMNDPNHWQDLNITAIGENASYGYILSGTHLVEWVFDSDPEHRENQLKPSWNLACPGISGVTVNIIFGQR